jgi:hypothetical protein
MLHSDYQVSIMKQFNYKKYLAIISNKYMTQRDYVLGI